MNDKELLVMAAKAVGEIGEYVEDYSPGDYYADQFYHGNECGILTGPVGCRHVWNPLTSDGDALRLAVELKFDVMTRWGEAYSAVLDREGIFTMQLDTDLDMCAATRRAIVRAAAEIGSKL